jgi:hypothetical protein
MIGIYRRVIVFSATQTMAAATAASRRNLRHEKSQRHPALTSVASISTVNLPESKEWIGSCTLEMLMLNG